MSTRSMRLPTSVLVLLLAVALAACEVAADSPAPPTPSPVATSRPPGPSPGFGFRSEGQDLPADRTPDVLARIPVGGQPSDLVLAPVTGRLYVSSRSGGITVLDTASRKAIATFEAGDEPFGLAVDEMAGLLYVADAQTDRDGRVVVVDTVTRQVVDTIAVGDRAWPVDIALDRERGLLFVACNGNGTLAVVGTRTRQVVPHARGRHHPDRRRRRRARRSGLGDGDGRHRRGRRDPARARHRRRDRRTDRSGRVRRRRPRRRGGPWARSPSSTLPLCRWPPARRWGDRGPSRWSPTCRVGSPG